VSNDNVEALWTFADDGLATRLEVFLNEADALEAAGLAR
jgi:hypothetical protein